jgi:CRP-like cAMP-binding protein
LAFWIGARRETVNKVLASYREQGLIDVDGRKITILDRAGLERSIRY